MKARIKYKTIIYSVSYLASAPKATTPPAQEIAACEVELLHKQTPTGDLVQVIDPTDPNRILTIATEAIEIFNDAVGVWQKIVSWWQGFKGWWRGKFGGKST